MGFLNQIMLIGLAGVSVPILIHLLNRFRYREVDWAAMELLRRAMDVRSRRVRIEDLILLVLRCLAVALLAMAMARPTLNANGAKLLGGEARTGVVIALDASYSMAHRPGVHSRFDRAVDRARDVLQTLRPGDQVTIVLMGQRPRILLRNAAFDAERLGEHLAKAAVLAERLDVDLCLEQVASLVAEIKAPVRECYLISDSQELSWRQVSPRARKALDEIRQVGQTYYLSVAPGAGENLALTHLAMTSGALRQGSMVRYVAEVTNDGQRTARNVPVTLEVNGKTADRRVAPLIEPGQTALVPLLARLSESGHLNVSAHLARDALSVDDARFAAANVHKQIRVLLVDGDPARSAYDSETYYLLKALVPDPRKASQASIQPKRITTMELPLQRPGDFDLVILANVPDLRTAQVTALRNFVEQGGGLIVFLGDKVSPALANARFATGATSLLPAKLDKELSVREGQEGWPIEAAAGGHPLSRFLARLPAALVDEARVSKLLTLAPEPGARTILRVAGPDVPLLVEKRLGRGQVLLAATSADRDWSNIVINPAYLILVHESVSYLTRQAHERPFEVGQPLVVPLPRQATADQAVLTAPSGQEQPIQVSGGKGEHRAECPLPEEPGIYRLSCAGLDEPIKVAVNVDPAESAIATLGPEALAGVLGDLPVVPLTGDNIADQVTQSRRGVELWRMLMIAGLVVLLVESLLARYFTRRMSVRDGELPHGAFDARPHASASDAA